MTRRLTVLAALVLLAGPAHATSFLGSADAYVGLTANGHQKFTISSGSTVVTGDLFVGDGTNDPDLDFSGGGSLTGTIFHDPDATLNLSGGSTASGGSSALSNAQSDQISADLAAAFAAISALGADQSLGDVSGDTTITAAMSGLNVIDLTSLELQGGATLGFAGPASASFLVRISDTLVTGGNSIIDAGSFGAANVLFIVDGDITKSGGTHDGTFVSKTGDVTLSGGSHDGAYLVAGAGKELKYQSGPTVNFVPTTVVPEPTVALLLGAGLVGLALAGSRAS